MSDQENRTPGPWDADLATSFEDPAVRAQVDEFLRGKVQPHVTRLEQKSADLADAQKLYDDLQNDPGATFIAISEELFGEGTGDKLIAALQAGEIETTPEGGVQTTEGTKPADLDPETREAVEFYQQQKQQTEYTTALQSWKDANPDKAVPDELFHAFVASADGDFDTAYAGYAQHRDAMKAEFGLTPAEVAEIVEEPPAVIKEGGTAATPLEPKKQSLGDAIDDWWNTDRVSAPPTVGGV